MKWTSWVSLLGLGAIIGFVVWTSLDVGAVRCEVCQDDGWIGYPVWADSNRRNIRVRKVACPHGCPLADPAEDDVLATFPPGEEVAR